MEGYENNEGQGQEQEQAQQEGQGLEQTQGKNGRDIIFSKVIRAGKRTYFLDVKATRKDDYYLTITESKKRFKKNGKRFFEKHKVFLYKEDFDKFTESLEEVINFIKEEKGLDGGEERDYTQQNQEQENEPNFQTDNYTSNVEFEDLEGNKE
ncbi:MAG: DUF3276 family protein [Bacteroidota bacterium]